MRDGFVHSDETKEKISASCRGYKHTEGAKKKISLHNCKHWLGKHRSLSTKKKLREANLRRFQDKRNHPMFGRKHTAEANQKNSLAHKKLFREDTGYRSRVLQAALPNKAEIKLRDFLEDLFPGKYAYVGDGRAYISGRCPDFLSQKDKKIIELFGEYWHIGKEEQDEARLRSFHLAGYQALVIWEKELSDLRTLARKVQQFDELK